MSIPKFSDVTKRSHNILAGFYEISSFDVSLRSKQSGNDFMITTQSGKVSMGSKVGTSPEYGVEFQQKWNSDNVMFGEVAFNNCAGNGTRLGVTGCLMPGSGEVAAAAQYQIQRQNMRADLTVVSQKGPPRSHNEFVMRLKDWYIACQLSGNFNASDWHRNRNLGLGYNNSNFEIGLMTKNFQDISVMVYKKIDSSVEAAFKVYFNGNKSDLETGCAYQLENGSKFLVKANTEAQIGLGYSSMISNGLTVKMCTNVDAKNKNITTFMQRCKISFGLSLEI